ncbi:DUF3293 domain-containing protein [Nitrosospira lacus]|uniref:DUF3293 domain-containing protein n=1 Tax=Nitrosospira lacus TaxID=1288494 RepID=UPI00039F84D5|nr:DUF3293 domain-containing protein [Nitrosospira lacus]
MEWASFRIGYESGLTIVKHDWSAFLIQAEISPALIAAYRATKYRAALKAESGSGTVILRIDEYSEPLSRLFTASKLKCAAFITACNPYSVPQSHEKNLMACARLRNKLDRKARPGWIFEGESHDPSGAWPAEKSFLVLGLDLETSRALGKEFGQNAIVWAGADAIPRLILLR